MADGAILESSRAQIVERRRYTAQAHVERRVGRRKNGVTLQTHKLHLRPRQHPRVRGAVRLMTCDATLQPHWSMFKGKRSDLVTVAVRASGLVGARQPNRAMQRRTVLVVAIDATHSAFRKAVFVWFLKAGPDVGMASGAQSIHVGLFAGYQPVRRIL